MAFVVIGLQCANFLRSQTMTEKSAPAAKKLSPRTKPTGQKRSLERGKSTRKKNPGKRAHKGG
jgi:hypothetical protein